MSRKKITEIKKFINFLEIAQENNYENLLDKNIVLEKAETFMNPDWVHDLNHIDFKKTVSDLIESLEEVMDILNQESRPYDGFET